MNFYFSLYRFRKPTTVPLRPLSFYCRNMIFYIRRCLEGKMLSIPEDL